MTSVAWSTVDVESALDLDQRAFGRVHHLLVDHLGVVQVHRLGELERGELGHPFGRRQKERDHDDAVAGPLDLGLQQALVAQLGGALQAHVDVVFGVELVGEGHLLDVAQRAAADQVARLVLVGAGRAGVVPVAVARRQMVDAEVMADRRLVVGGPLDDGAGRHAAVGEAHDAVVVGLGILARIDEVALLDRREVAAVALHRLEEQHGPLFELADPGLELRVVEVELDELAQAVHADERLAGGVDGVHVVVVPGHVAALVGGDRALDVGARQAADHEVHDVRDGRLAAARLHVARVLLGAHLVLAEQVAQGDRVGQVHAHAGRRRRVGRHGRQADVLLWACRPPPSRRS